MNKKKFGNIVSMLVYKKLLQIYLVCFFVKKKILSENENI